MLTMYSFGFGRTRKRAASPNGNVEDIKKPRKLQRSGSWRAWYRQSDNMTDVQAWIGLVRMALDSLGFGVCV